MTATVDSLPVSVDTLKMKGDLGDVSYSPGLTHRIGIIVSGAAPGTGTNVPNATQLVPATNISIAGNFTYDFRPDGGAVADTRSIVDISSCASCHNGKGLAHGGSRKDPNLCVTCHTDQVKYGMSGEATRSPTDPLVLNGTTQNTTAVLDGRAIGQFPNLIHKIHMGDKLGLTGYNYIPNGSGIGHQFDKNEWIQDPRDCTKCHNGADKTDINQATKTKDGDNWKNKPNRLACGACHDDVSFTPTAAEVTAGTTASGLVAHPGGAATDDSTCASCHAVSGAAIAPIDVAHRAEAPTANNPVQITDISTISYEIKSAAVTAGVPSVVFRIKKDGTPITAFATPTMAVSSGAVVVKSSPAFQAIPGFIGGPAFYIAYAVPQDGVAAPADFNAYQSVSLTNLLVASGSPKAGTLTGPDADGYWTATLTGDTVGQPVTSTCTQKTTTITGNCVNPSPIVIPTSGANKAVMVTASIIGNFNQVAFPAPTTGLTPVAIDTTSALGAKWNTLVTGTAYLNGTTTTGLIVKTPLKKLAATGYTARRVVVDTDKCESCHEQLGTAVDFHGGARNDGTSCAICHNPSRTSSGWSANASTFIHGIHAGTNPVSVNAAKATGIAVVGDPGSGAGGAFSTTSTTTYSWGKRTVPFSWHRDQAPGVAGGFNAAATVYPGILKRCDSCHVPNAVNFGLNGSALLPTLLWSTSATGKYNSATDTPKALPRDPATGLIMSYLTANNTYSYGNVFGFTPAGSVVGSYTPSVAGVAGTATAVALAPAGGVIIPADKETLVESPVTAACVACHDSSVAKLHFKTYGGVFYGRRLDTASVYSTFNATTGSVVFNNQETCLICHGAGRDQDAAAVHEK
jgi:OmcA/MtrC family decaheme c-type cytochrome